MPSGPNESVFRYVVTLMPETNTSCGMACNFRTRNGTTSSWELYRVPIRTPDATIGTPNLRLIQHLRVTVAAPADAGTARRRWPLCPCPHAAGRFALGAPRRSAYRRHLGLGRRAKRGGDRLGRLDREQHRPGVHLAARRVSGQSRNAAETSSALGTQINEKSLRLIARGLEVGERAEAYLRLPAGPQNVLGYRELRGVDARSRARVGGGRFPGVHQAGQRRPQLLSLPRSSP